MKLYLVTPKGANIKKAFVQEGLLSIAKASLPKSIKLEPKGEKFFRGKIVEKMQKRFGKNIGSKLSLETAVLLYTAEHESVSTVTPNRDMLRVVSEDAEIGIDSDLMPGAKYKEYEIVIPKEETLEEEILGEVSGEETFSFLGDIYVKHNLNQAKYKNVTEKGPKLRYMMEIMLESGEMKGDSLIVNKTDAYNKIKATGNSFGDQSPKKIFRDKVHYLKKLYNIVSKDDTIIITKKTKA